MSIDSEALRLDTAVTLQADGFLLTIRQPVYSQEKRTGENDVYAWALRTRNRRLESRGDNVGGSQQVYLIAALESDSSGGFTGNALALTQSDMVLQDGQWLRIIDPGGFSPANVTIFYKAAVAMRTDGAQTVAGTARPWGQ